MEVREKMRKHQFYHFIRATLHSEAYIMEAREKRENINFHFSTERDYIREADIIHLHFLRLTFKI